MKFAKMPEDTGAVLSEDGQESESEDDETSGDESEEEREKRLAELANQVHFDLSLPLFEIG